MIYRTEDLCIDLPHTRESTRAVLEARYIILRGLRIASGAGGNRDIERIGMGESSGKYADFSIITTEHNRFGTV